MKSRMRSAVLAILCPKREMTCAHCGERLYMARGAEYVDPGCIRHHWICDECGYSFKTSSVEPKMAVTMAVGI
jgi:ribosomal protein L37AE/L43A